MFCSKCGKKLNDGDLFCSACGFAIISDKSLTSSTSTSVNNLSEINRDVAVCHLYDLRALECTCSVIEEKLNTVKTNADSLTINEWITEPYISPRFTFKNVLNEIIAHKWFFIITLLYGIVWLAIPSSRSRLFSIFPFSLFLFRLLYIIVKETICFIKGKNDYGNQYKAYEESVKVCNETVRKNQIVYRDLKAEENKLREQLAAFKTTLTNAYSANIIPQQFRNIYAIYYIYDYMSTSQESLSSAFLHCNLEEIKKRLEEVIMQNRQMIVQQALIISQNEIMIDQLNEQGKKLDNIQEQNQQMLQHAAAIEANTGRAAQYAQVAASNAEACALFHLADYLNN